MSKNRATECDQSPKNFHNHHPPPLYTHLLILQRDNMSTRSPGQWMKAKETITIQQ